MTPEKARQYLWYLGNLSWKLHSDQVMVYEKLRALPQSVREAVVLIARRWGKSYLDVVMGLEDCLLNPHTQVFIVGPELKHTRKILTPLVNLITRDAPHGLIKPTKSELLWKVGRSELVIGAFDTAFETFRGLDALNIYFEETGLANPDEYEYTQISVFNPTLQSARRKGVGGRKVHFTTPSKLLNHPLHTKTMAKAELSDALFIRTIEDNPLLTPVQIEEEIFEMGGRESPHVQRELYCKIVKDPVSTVCPEFDKERHVKEMEPPPFAYWMNVLDFGGVLDPHAQLLCYRDFKRAKFCIYDERWHPINTETGIIVKDGKEMEKQARWLDGDPYRISDCPGQVLVDLRSDVYDFRTINPDKEKGSWEAGISAVRLGFHHDEIEIHPRCKMLIACCEYGQYTKNRKDFERTEELGHLDPFAALMYGFKHQIIDNPFPAHVGKSRFTHHISKRDQEQESTLDSAFYKKKD